MSERGNKPEMPSAPGWYPDPFSADGTGERYFDGKRWGTSDRPLARHGHPEPTRLPTGSARQVYRARRRLRGGKRGGGASGTPPRRNLQPVIVVVVFVAAVLGLAWWQSRGSSRHTSSTQITLPAPTQPPPSAEEQSVPIGKPAPFTAGPGKFEILRAQPDDPSKPVAWDPCRPIHYVVNARGAPADGAALLQRAIARVSKATGLRFVDDGPTEEPLSKSREAYQPVRYPNRWAPVLIAWSDENADPELAGYIEGVGGADPVYADPTHLVYVSGRVVFDRKDLAPASTPDRDLAYTAMLHELGHLVGLDHTSDRAQVMFSEGEFNVRDYGTGDLKGLALLGTQPCYPGI